MYGEERKAHAAKGNLMSKLFISAWKWLKNFPVFGPELWRGWWWRFPLVALWGAAVVFIGLGYLPIPSEPDTAAARSAANWSVAFLAIAVVLFAVHMFSQAAATERLEYLSFLLTVVLFVQAATIMTALAISAVVREGEVQAWVLPTVVLMVIFQLALLFSQMQALSWARGVVEATFDRLIAKAAINRPLTAEDLAVVRAAKRLAPVDLRQGTAVSQAAGYPGEWADVEALLDSINLRIPLKDTLRMSPEMQNWDSFYTVSGTLSAVLGSLTVVLGAAAL